MRTDDITALLGPTDGPGGEPFRQGTVLTYNPSDGSNQISVAGIVLTNVPLLNIGDVTLLKTGDVVVLAKFRSSWAVLGRIITPGASQLATGAVGFAGVGTSGVNFSIPTAYAARASQSIAVPAWANQANVLAVANILCLNSRTVSDFLQMRVQIDGSPGGAGQAQAAAGTWAHTMASAGRSTMAVTPGGSFTVAAEVLAGGGAWAVNASNLLNLDGIVIFRKV